MQTYALTKGAYFPQKNLNIKLSLICCIVLNTDKYAFFFVIFKIIFLWCDVNL